MSIRICRKSDMGPSVKPLNGENTHPLSDFAREWLSQIADKPVPKIEINPGVRDRLLREGLVKLVELPSPYKTQKGKNCQHLQITQAGKKELSPKS